jgi:hypothetical protein
VQAEVEMLDGQLSRFDLGDVEDVVDDSAGRGRSGESW